MSLRKTLSFLWLFGLVCQSAGFAQEPKEEDVIASDSHEGHAGVEGKGNRYSLKTRKPIALLNSTLHFQIFSKQGRGCSGDIYASLDEGKSWVRISAWNPIMLRAGIRNRNWQKLSLSPFVTRMKVRETDRLSIEFRWKGGKDALGIRQVIWAKRGAGTSRPPSLGESAICLLSLDEVSRSADGKSTTKDATKNEIDGEVYGAGSVDGAVGRALQFDGVDDFVLLPELHGHVTRDLEAISVSLWLKPADRNGMTFDVGFYGSSVTLWSGPGAVFVISKDAGGVNLKYKEPSGRDWHHIVAVWDGRSQTIYIDGKLAAKAQTTRAGTLGKKSIGHGAGRLGSQSKSPDRKDRFFRGALDEVAVFDRALSQSEVKSLFEMREKSRSVTTLIR